MAVLLICKNDKDSSKNESAKEWYQHYTYIFSDAQGQKTLESVAGTGRNMNSSKRLCITSLHAGGAR